MILKLAGLAAGGIGLLLVWSLGGDWIALVVDRIRTTPANAPPVRPATYSDGRLKFGEIELPGAFTAQPDSTGRLVLRAGEKQFVLGPVTKTESWNGLYWRDFEPEEGDVASFAVEHGWFAWPTPFEMNFMTGKSPSWKRHAYYRLSWKKPSGASLEIVWRYQQWHYPNDGWTSGMYSKEGVDPMTLLIRP